MLYVFLYHTPNQEKMQVFSHFPHKIHPKSGTNPHFLTILHFHPLSSPSHSREKSCSPKHDFRRLERRKLIRVSPRIEPVPSFWPCPGFRPCAPRRTPRNPSPCAPLPRVPSPPQHKKPPRTSQRAAVHFTLIQFLIHSYFRFLKKSGILIDSLFAPGRNVVPLPWPAPCCPYLELP